MPKLLRPTWAVLALLICLAAATPAVAQDDARADRDRQDLVLFRKTIAERDRAARELHDLDQQAARELAAGKNPVSLYAKQQDAQDRIDQSELRLQMLSLRVDEPVPPLPDVEAEARQSREARTIDKLDSQFGRGRRRAVEALRQQTVDLLRSLDYSRYLVAEAVDDKEVDEDRAEVRDDRNDKRREQAEQSQRRRRDAM